MRLSMRRLVQWTCIVVFLQFVVYYWTIKRAKKLEAPVMEHKYLESIVGKGNGTCSYNNCPGIKNDMINVHLIPHCHIDVGWLKTVDQYYTGEDHMGVLGCVRCTLNTTITELLKDPSRRFIFIEMKYLSRYWHEVDESQREIIRQLIKERRLEIINGGWVMSDAGVTMYNDIIDQHTLGFDFIRKTFGPCSHTRTSWHVDQFGHSREHASLLAQMGYDSIFIGRVDFLDLAERKQKKKLELVWNTSPQNLRERSTIFVQSTFDGYYAPPGYVFDKNPFILSQNASYPNVKEFVNILLQRAKSFQTKHLLVPMGSDFGYINANYWFENIDYLIKEINSMQNDSKSTTKLNLLYSTPSCYTYYVSKERQLWNVKTDDLFPYGIFPGVYWSGYYTTRGGFKLHIRKAGQILQSCKQLSIFANLDDTYDYKIHSLRDVLAVMQHHDAITGTQTLSVLQDYNRMLSKAENQCLAVINKAYQKLWNSNTGYGNDNSVLTANYCPDLNISSCVISETSSQFVVTVYNPLSWYVDMPIRIPIKLDQATVKDWNGDTVQSQDVPIPAEIKQIPERSTKAQTEVVFVARLPPMSMTPFEVTHETEMSNPLKFEESFHSDIVIENEHLALTFSATTGKLVSIFNKASDFKLIITQEFAYYEGEQGSPRPSGAYVFVPRKPDANIITPGKIGIKVIKGTVVQEVHQKFNSWVYQIVRLYKGAKHAEFQWTVGPLDDVVGKEVISRFITDINSNETFYTDSNGREIIKRIRENPVKLNPKIKEFVSGNYYPITSRIYIQDKERRVRFSVITDRSYGGTSLASGEVELMVHRRLLYDDGLGVSEALKDNGLDYRGIIYTGKHYLCVETISDSILLTKHLALETHLSPLLMFTALNNNKFDSYFKQHNFLSAVLPDSIQILTFDKIDETGSDQYLLRLEHVIEEEEHAELSKPVEISLQNLFQAFEIVSAEETTLGANFRPHEIERFEWATTEGRTQPNIESPDYKIHMELPFKIKIYPMEIRTFRVQIARLI